MRNIIWFVAILFIIGCSEEYIPKPKAYLNLEYPEQSFISLPVERSYVFDILTNVTTIPLPQNWLKITYPELKASVDITYRPVNNNLKELFLEAEKLVLEHTIKADFITWRDFERPEAKVYGKMCEIGGNAASQVQFHVTDSSKHFLKGSLFFYAKPNYDSIYPAVEYVKKDMIRIMETLAWDN